MSTTLSSPDTDVPTLSAHQRGARDLDHTLGSFATVPPASRGRVWHHGGPTPRHTGDLTTDLAASLFLSLFVTPVGAARAEVALTDLADAVDGTGPRGIRAAGRGGEALVRRWERAGLVGPVGETDTRVCLLPRGTALLNGPFRWDRLTRALRRHLS